MSEQLHASEEQSKRALHERDEKLRRAEEEHKKLEHQIEIVIAELASEREEAQRTSAEHRSKQEAALRQSEEENKQLGMKLAQAEEKHKEFALHVEGEKKALEQRLAKHAQENEEASRLQQQLVQQQEERRKLEEEKKDLFARVVAITKQCEREKTDNARLKESLAEVCFRLFVCC